MRIRPLSWFALVCLAVLPAPALRAEDAPFRPTVLVRIDSLDNLIAHARYLAELAGKDEQAKQAEKMLRSFGGDKGLVGIDTKKPLGLYGKVAPNLPDSEVVVLLPVVDDKTVLKQLEDYGIKATKGDDDVYEVELPRPLNFTGYIRFANGYAYVTARDQAVEAKGKPLPKDQLLAPEKVLGTNETAVALVRVNVDEVPESIRDVVVGQAARGLAEAKDKKVGGESPAERQARQAGMDEFADAIKSVMTEGGELSLRFDLDRKAGELALAAQFKGKTGSKLAERIAELGKAKSVVAGIFSPDSAIHYLIHVTLPERMRKSLGDLIDQGFQKALKDQKDATQREEMQRLFEAVSPTLKAGELDTAADLRGPSAAGKYTLVVGLAVKDGAALDKALRHVATKIPEDRKGKLKLDADKVGSTAIHRLDLSKEFDAEARQMFGEEAIYFAIRDNAAFVGLGEKGLGALKEALDKEPRVGKIALAEVSMSRLVPLLVKQHPGAAEAAKDAFGSGSGNDKIVVTLEGGDALKLRMSMKAQLVKFFGLLEQAKNKGQ
jgi:hypothetical protein